MKPCMSASSHRWPIWLLPARHYSVASINQANSNKKTKKVSKRSKSLCILLAFPSHPRHRDGRRNTSSHHVGQGSEQSISWPYRCRTTSQETRVDQTRQSGISSVAKIGCHWRRTLIQAAVWWRWLIVSTEITQLWKRTPVCEVL